LSVFLNKEADGMPTATVVVPEDQLSLAIGRNGQNARLAAKLSGWRIDIKGLFEAVSDTLFKIQNDPRYAQYQELEAGTIPRIESIMEKKAEGRPISPEEYRELHHFNKRVETGLIKERREITKQQQARIHAAKDAVPDDAYDLPIMTLGLPTKVENLLNEAGLTNVGELAYRLLLVPSTIIDIDGIGPTYVEEIESALEVMIGYEPLSEEFDIDEELILPGITAEEEEELPEAEEETTEPEAHQEEAIPEEDQKTPESGTEDEEDDNLPVEEAETSEISEDESADEKDPDADQVEPAQDEEDDEVGQKENLDEQEVQDDQGEPEQSGETEEEQEETEEESELDE
jgi:N utilization substance protein A